MKILLSLLLVPLAFATSYGQHANYKFERLGVAEGLPGHGVYDMLTDSNGYLWIATDNGLVRYDGHEMTVFKTVADDSSSISHDHVTVLMEDSTGNIWVGTAAGGLNRFDPRKHVFQRYPVSSTSHSGTADAFVNAIYQTRDGTIWIGTDGGLDAYSEGEFKHYAYDEGGQGALRNPVVTDMFEDENDELWVATHGGVHIINPQTEAVRVYRMPAHSPVTAEDERINVLLRSTDGRIWIGSDGGLEILDQAAGTAERFQHVQGDVSTLSSNRVHAIIEDRQGVIWIGTVGNDISDGLNRFDPNTGSFQRFRTDPNSPYALSGNRVISLYADTSDHLWIGTLYQGINKLDLRGERITHYFAHPDRPNGLTGNEVFALYTATGGDLWVGTWNGSLARFDPATGIAEVFTRENSGLAGNDILDIHGDKNGHLWVGTLEGLNRFEPESGEFTIYRHNPDDNTTIASDAVTSILSDRDGNLWVGSWNQGISMKPAGQNTFERLTNDPEDPNSLPENAILKIAEDRRGVLWMKSWETLYSYDPQVKQFETVPVADVNDFIVDAEGRLWLGTDKEGLIRYSYISGQAEIFSTNHGLPHDAVTGLVEDKNGDIWVATARGIARFDPVEKSFSNFNTDPMIRSNKLGFSPAVVMENGAIFFGGGNGVFGIHPDAMIDSDYEVPTRITALSIDSQVIPPGGGSLLKSNVSFATDINLRHDQNDLQISFVGLGFRNPEAYAYRFRLSPYDPGWVIADSRREARYTNLPHGNYHFVVHAANEDGVWNEAGATLGIVVRPPWWKTPFAYLMYVLFSGATVLGWVQFRVGSLERKAKMLEKEVEKRTSEVTLQRDKIEESRQVIQEQADRLVEHDRMKSRFFANISHEFRTPLTLILGPLRDAQDGLFGNLKGALPGQINLMERNGRRLQRLINQLLQLAKFESGSVRLEAELVDAVILTRRIVRSFSSLAERKHILLQMTVEWIKDSSTEDVEVSSHPELYVDVEKYEQVLNNLLSNALKFTPNGGNVQVNLSTEENDFVLEVLDSGAGIPAKELDHVFERFMQAQPRAHDNEGSSGLGLALAKEWVQMHRGSIHAENRSAGGACFKVTFPLGRTHLSNEEINQPGKQIAPELMTDRGDIADFDVFLSDSNPENSVSDANRHHVLLIDDNSDLRAYMHRHLSTRYRVSVASDGVEGLERAVDLRPDLIISDVMMPNMDGYELCKRVKNSPDLADVPVILLTAKASDEDRIEGLMVGADDYIYKPFNALELLVRAENLIDIRLKLRQTYSRQIIEVTPTEVEAESSDVVFIRRVQEVVETHIDNANFGTDWLADEIGLSPRQLRRRIKDITQLSATGFIRTLRLRRAAQLLEQEAGTVAEVAYAVGFNDPKYFSRLFRQVFGTSPSAYVQG